MAKYGRFEELPVWQEAVRLYNTVLDLLEVPGVALSPGFRNQLDRAALSVSNKNPAKAFANSVLPTPVGPKKIKLPIGRFGSDKPALERLIASETDLIASSCPITRL